MYTVSSCVALLAFLTVAAAEDVFVTTKYGQVVGTRYNISTDWAIDTFLGIPYAEPPVGILRWNKSIPVQPWSGVKSARNYGNVCWQNAEGTEQVKKFNVTQSEDCLNLNVYAPRKSSHPGLMPVMVYIHGGGFSLGAGLLTSGDQLAKKDVVVVTINYRLGALGFLSTEDQAAPGNFGLLDQILALHWVQDCIGNFGGDPKRVTAFGESAGGASVSLLMTSPLAKGLFHAAITESGVGLTHWAVSMKTDVYRPRDKARVFGIKLGCIKATTQEIIDCLRTKNAKSISSTQVKAALDRMVPWTPVVDHYTLPDSPLNSWTKGKVMDIPVIRGTNSGEWAGAVAKIQGNHTGIKASYFLEQIREFCDKRYIRNRKTIEDDIKMVYATPYNLSTPELVRDSYLQFLSDYLFTAPIVLETTLDAKLSGNGKTYLYEFSYVTKNTLPKWEGAPHTYEIQFVFGYPFTNKGSDDDLMMSLTMMNMWTDFAKHGNPTPKPIYGSTWKPFTSVYDQSYFVIDSRAPTNHQNFRYKATKLWNTVIPALKDEQTRIIG